MLNKHKCTSCGERSKCVSVDGKWYCPACHSDQFFTCDKCEEVKSRDDYMRAVGDDLLCRDCFNDNCFYCSNCGDAFWDSESCDYNNNSFCRDCYEANFDDCRRCGNSYHNGDLENGYCELCLPDVSFRSRSVVINRQAGNKKGKYIKHDRFVGIELEVENGDQRQASENVHGDCGVEEDASLQNGIEIQTPPASLDRLEELIEDTCRVLYEAECQVSDRCGLHVHIEAIDLGITGRRLCRVINTFYAIEDILYAILPKSRWGNRYCIPIRHIYGRDNFPDLKKEAFEKRWYRSGDKRSIDERKKHKGDDTRYCGVNLHSTLYRGTVEFRQHSGTINAKKILSWISLLLHLLDYAKNSYNQQEIDELNQLDRCKEKVDLFLQTFNLPPSLRQYVLDRLAKFNPQLLEAGRKETVEDKHRGITDVERNRRRIEEAIFELPRPLIIEE